MDRPHRRRAGPGHPDQRGRRQPARRRGRARTAPGRCSSCSSSSLNFFVGIFNLLPLLPLDGGHIAIAWFERARSWLYARLGRPDPGRVDYLKLMPITYAVILIGGAFTLLTVTADIVNPITLFSR